MYQTNKQMAKSDDCSSCSSASSSSSDSSVSSASTTNDDLIIHTFRKLTGGKKGFKYSTRSILEYSKQFIQSSKEHIVDSIAKVWEASDEYPLIIEEILMPLIRLVVTTRNFNLDKLKPANLRCLLLSAIEEE